MIGFSVHSTAIDGVRTLERTRHSDGRGFLERLFCRDTLRAVLGDREIVQINHTRTVGVGVVRGIHFQHPPFAETKFVHCLKGKIFDVAVDLRRGSPTFLQWHAEILSADEPRTLIIPEGVGHGFQTLEDECELLYFHTAPYTKDVEGGLNARDARLAIAWPLGISIQSDRDRNHPMLTADFSGIEL